MHFDPAQISNFGIGWLISSTVDTVIFVHNSGALDCCRQSEHVEQDYGAHLTMTTALEFVQHALGGFEQVRR